MSYLDTILALPKITHDLVQGSPEWDQFRLDHRGASEAAAALGLSKKIPRNELLRMKKTRLPREFSEWFQKNILDNGHETEAAARPIVEEALGEDLYPVTCSRGLLSASSDGITLDDGTIYEHKQWNEELAALVREGIVPDEHMPQCQQLLLVHGARRVRFTVSDGTREKMVWVDVLPDRAWWERIVAGWAQFEIDLAEYEPPEVVERVTAAPIEALPAVSVRMDGALAVVSNLDVFGAKLREFVEKIPKKPTTDQEFIDADAAVKALKKAEEALDGAEANALGQVQSVETLTRTIGDLRTIARTARLATEKLVTARKTQIRTEEVQRGKDALAAHITGLNQALGKPYMPPIPADFAGAISGKKTLDSLRNAIDTELARAKIAAGEVAGRIQINLNWLRENAKGYEALFPDTGTIVLKAPEDLQALAQNRINEHKAAEERRLEAERERIRVEEQAKAEKAARAAQEAEDALIASIWSNARRIEGDSSAYIRKAIVMFESGAKDWMGDPRPRVAGAAASAREEMNAKLEAAMEREAAEAAKPAPTAAPAVAQPVPASQGEHKVVPLGARAARTPPTLTVGKIAERLGFALTAEFLAKLGFEPAGTARAAKLYHETDFPLMCDSLVAHVRTVAAKQLQAA